MPLDIFLFVYHTAAQRLLVGLSLKDLLLNGARLQDRVAYY